MKKTFYSISPFLLLLLLLQPAQAQPSQNTDEDMERITVDGSDLLITLRHNFYRAEEDFFSLFNELTTDKSFHITCDKKKRHAFTRIKQRDCESKYQDEESFKLTQRAIRSSNPTEAEVWMKRLPMQGEEYREQRRMKKKQVEAMKKLVAENPELLAKLVALNEAKTKYEEAKAAD